MKKRSLKASFVITFAGSSAALVTPGCFSDVTSNPPPVATNPPEVVCPESAPNPGDPCPEPGLVCKSSDLCEADFKCGADGVWATEDVVSCNPPPVLECPEAMPTPGDTTCFGEGTCEYMDGCGQTITVTCSDGRWEVSEPAPPCNPPAPPCDSYGTADGCAGVGYCRWLVPGCGEPDGVPALPKAGCYPLAGCADDTQCAPGAACKQFMVTPACVEQGCDSCGEAASLCM